MFDVLIKSLKLEENPLFEMSDINQSSVYMYTLLSSLLTWARRNAIKVHVVAKNVSESDFLDFCKFCRTKLDPGVPIFVEKSVRSLQTSELAGYDGSMCWPDRL